MTLVLTSKGKVTMPVVMLRARNTSSSEGR